MRITVSYDEVTCEITRTTNGERPTSHGFSDLATLAAWRMPEGGRNLHEVGSCAQSTPHPRRYSR